MKRREFLFGLMPFVFFLQTLWEGWPKKMEPPSELEVTGCTSTTITIDWK
jgi:hypothetical protein